MKTLANKLPQGRHRALALLMALVLFAVQGQAIPAQRRPFTVTNSDGTTLTLVLCGDEHFHFYATTDGIPAVQEENGDWRLAPELTDSITATWTAKSQRRNAHRMQRAAKTKARRVFGQPNSFVGDKRGIVILVNFYNKSMKTSSTKLKFRNIFNMTGYSNDNHYGSVKDYFRDQSYGKLNITFDVFGPVTTTRNMEYYGANDSSGNDKRVATLATEACQLADAAYDINWADYDWDGDGEVDQVYIIYAGYSEAAGASSSTIWPHEWALSEGKWSGDGKGAIQLGGVTIDTYAMSSELRGTSGSNIDGIGTACHEFSHCLGLPDFYDTSYAGGFGMDSWDVMDAGCYNGASYSGECPSGFTAYERWFSGWLNFTELDRPATVIGMPSLQDEPVAYIIYNDGNRDEYFIMENRQPTGWFRYVEGDTQCHGMLVCHVDYDEAAWMEDAPNNTADHQRMSIIPASGVYGTFSKSYQRYIVTAAEHRSQLFGSNANTNELTNTSHTNCGGELFNLNTDNTKNMNKPITNIVEADGLISFDFMGGGSPINAITAPLSPTLDADTQYYNLQGMPVTPTTSGIYLRRRGGKTEKVFIR